MTVMVAGSILSLRAQRLAKLDRAGAVMLMSCSFPWRCVGVSENYHLGSTFCLYVLPNRQKWLRMISDIVALAFGIGWSGTDRMVS